MGNEALIILAAGIIALAAIPIVLLLLRKPRQPQQPQLQPPPMRQQQTDTVRQRRVEMEGKVTDLENLIFEERELDWNRERYERLWQQRCQANSQPQPKP